MSNSSDNRIRNGVKPSDLNRDERSGMNFLKRFAFCAFVLALCAAFAMPALAQDQSSSRGNLSGLVYDSSQSLVPGAEVTITGPIGSLTQNSSGQGSFLFSTLIPGLYTVRVQKPGFKV